MHAPTTPMTERARPLGTGPYAPAGTPFMGRYRPAAWQPGRPEHIFPMRVVRDDVRGIVGWLAPGTPRLEMRDPGGAASRDIALESRFHPDRAATQVSARVAWRGPGVLRLTPAAKPWSVMVFWSTGRDGTLAFDGWYVNLENPGHREGTDLVTSDHVLDIWIDPTGTVTWKDEDELAAAVDQGRYTADQATTIRQHGEQAIAEFRAGAWPFGEDWSRWLPPAEWTVPSLPGDTAWDLDLLDGPL